VIYQTNRDIRMFYASTALAVVRYRRALRTLHTGSALAVRYKTSMWFYRNRLNNGYPCAWMTSKPIG
jgi:hypothetical protein